ncbi:magnetosome protein MamK [Fundidesulfovibrio magnetotacticus]|uniref:Magnetosome protein MamK n=1 Tax=Fundidesulfovibrio magnetotacticus TaxID=2730080 RepID=A0A6V8LRA8_9BACT|nr:MamK family actin-like protein [Fundidesulfovibrio magnetotacticus]GFK92306.1 magnetosome protein MamK [Fundidesulfovibrio magnetotacticus]
MSNLKVLNVGIDLGTSRSVIACDNGVRTFVPSYVGYPKDMVSRKLIGKDVVFGLDALKNRLALDVRRPFEKGMIKYSNMQDVNAAEFETYKKVAHDLLSHLIDLVKAEENGPVSVRAVLGAPALASTQNKKLLVEIARDIVDDVLIASEPFAVAYGLGILSNALIVDIGAGTIDLCRMQGSIPTEDDQITLTRAGDHIDEVFMREIKLRHPEVDITLNMVKQIKENNSTISDKGECVVAMLPIKGKPTPVDVTEELLIACRSIVPDVVEAIRVLIASFDPEFQSLMKENVILAGGGSQIGGLAREIEKFMQENLGYGKVIKAEEPLFAGANGGLMLCKDMPNEFWDELKNK